MKRPILKSSIIGALLLASSACSSGGEDGIDVTTSWLGSLHRYEQISGAGRSGVFLMKNGSRPAHVARIVVEPAEITVSSRSDLNAISPAAYEKLRDVLTAALAREAAKQFPSSGAPADNADTYLLRVALTNLTVKRKTRKTGPAGLNDLEFNFDDAAIELGIRERRSNARRGAAIHRLQARNAGWNALVGRFGDFAVQAIAKAAEARDGVNRKAAQPRASAPAANKPSSAR